MSIVTDKSPIVCARHGGTKWVKCLKRNKNVVLTPEEDVRQRVLDFLINEKGIDKANIELEITVRSASGKRGRADIVIYDEDRKPYIVVECKESGTPVVDSGAVEQAKKYASKLKPTYIWVTNGDADQFFEKKDSGWKEIQTIAGLGSIKPFPTTVESKRGFVPIKKYLELLSREQCKKAVLELSDASNKESLDFMRTVHQLLFKTTFKLPFSHRGVHILEDRGNSYLKFSTPAGYWCGYYRVFLVATEGRVETAAVSVQQYEHEGQYGEMLLCVGFIKESRKHHALQLPAKNCHQVENGWEIWHNRRMNSVTNENVVKAVIESGREDLIYEYEEDSWISLGDLPNWKNLTWTKSKKTLANILHYALIRTELRDAHQNKK